MLDYVPGTTRLHRADVRTKLFVFSVFTVLLFLFKSPLYNLGFALFAVLLAMDIQIPGRRMLQLLQPLLPILLMVIVFSGFSFFAGRFQGEFANRVLFFGWPGERLPFTYGGLFIGITLALRIFAMAVLTAVLAYCTPLDEFIQFLRVLRVPRPVTFLLVTAIRFVPAMQKKTDRVFQAQRARGAKLAGGGWFGSVFAGLPIMVPLLVDSLRMSENLAIAMLNRGYGASKRWTPLKELRMTGLDFSVCVIAAVVLAFFVYLKGLGFGDV